MTVEPESIPELVEASRSAPQVLAVGARTKPRLSTTAATLLSTRHLRGMEDYDPGEFTFTALAGTPLAEINEALAEKGQYLPFDPMLVEAGSTLGGAVASGLSGPGRFRFGGVRDFILGVEFIDGSGELLRMGGKVVKNAAGFDLPKFLTGSLGRFGILTRLTFKVFPRPQSFRTVLLDVSSVAEAVQIMLRISNSRWEPQAIDLLPDRSSVAIRLGGAEPALQNLTDDILTTFPGRRLTDSEADSLWKNLTEVAWAEGDQSLIKIPLAGDQAVALCQALPEAELHLSAGGNVAYLASDPGPKLQAALAKLALTGLTLRGESPLWPGSRPTWDVEQRVKAVLDPQNRFPTLDS